MTEADGFLVQSRWGMKLHKAGCPCGVCKSKRKAACDSLQPDSPSELPVPHESSDLQGSSAATLDAAGSPKCNIQKQHQLRNGVRTAPAAMRTLRGQAAVETAVKPAVKGRLGVELAALGTPEVPMNRVRVPRQAATAAKAAIKKDLLEQNRRPGAAQLSTPKPTAHQLDPPAVKALPLENGNQSAAKQTVPRQKKQAKKRKAEGEIVTADESPAAADVSSLKDASQHSTMGPHETSARSKTASIKSGNSHRSQHSAAANQDTLESQAAPAAQPGATNSIPQSSRKAAKPRAAKHQKIQQNSIATPVVTKADPAAEAEMDLGAVDSMNKAKFDPRLDAEPQGMLELAEQARDKLALVKDHQLPLKSDSTADAQTASEAIQSRGATAEDNAEGGNAKGKVTATAESAADSVPLVVDSAQQELSPAEQFAQQVRSKAGWGPAVDVNVRGLMASSTLAGQPVHIQLKHREPVYLQGTILPNGMVKCAMHAGGPVKHECSLSEFEKLGASKERRPGENIHLTNFSMALKDFAALVNEIGETARSRCMVCNKGVGIIKCKGCSIAAHPQCVELTSRQQQANWFCNECKASGRDKLPQRPQDLPTRARAPSRPPARPQFAPAAAPSHAHAHPSISSNKGNETSCVSPPGRVHMAVPVSGMTPARRERNGNKHKRLFLGGPGALTHGEPVVYKTSQHGVLLAGEVRISPGSDANTGILCQCCNAVISCSKFEAHAGQGSRRAPYDNIFTDDGITLRARAAQLPPLTEEEGQMLALPRRRASGSRNRGISGVLGGIADGCRDVIHDLDHDAGGCSVCGRPDFALGEFCDRTMILCDQCEREFHVGCLRREGRCDLTQLPTGDWFCSSVCSSIWGSLNATVAAGLTPLDPLAYPPGYTIQMLRGRASPDSPSPEGTNAAIDIAQNVLQESFDPIIDKATKENLLLLMTKAEVKGEYDYRGMYTALLSHEGRPVCAAVMRAFGAQLAEVPLVATKADARRQGHCRVLMQAFEAILKKAGVRLMCLPAAHETVYTWIQGFGLSRMPLDDLDSACKELRLLIFPGTQVLQKQLLPPLPPTPTPQPDPIQSGQDVVLDTAAQLLPSLPATSTFPAEFTQDAQLHTAALPSALAPEALSSTAPQQPCALAIQQPSQVAQPDTAAGLKQDAQPHAAAFSCAGAAVASPSTAPQQPSAVASQQSGQLAQPQIAAELLPPQHPMPTPLAEPPQPTQDVQLDTAAGPRVVEGDSLVSMAVLQAPIVAAQEHRAPEAAVKAPLEGFAAEQAVITMATGHSDAAEAGSAAEGASQQAHPVSASPRFSPAFAPQAELQEPPESPQPVAMLQHSSENVEARPQIPQPAPAAPLLSQSETQVNTQLGVTPDANVTASADAQVSSHNSSTQDAQLLQAVHPVANHHQDAAQQQPNLLQPEAAASTGQHRDVTQQQTSLLQPGEAAGTDQHSKVMLQQPNLRQPEAAVNAEQHQAVRQQQTNPFYPVTATGTNLHQDIRQQQTNLLQSNTATGQLQDLITAATQPTPNTAEPMQWEDSALALQHQQPEATAQHAVPVQRKLDSQASDHSQHQSAIQGNSETADHGPIDARQQGSADSIQQLSTEHAEAPAGPLEHHAAYSLKPSADIAEELAEAQSTDAASTALQEPLEMQSQQHEHVQSECSRGIEPAEQAPAMPAVLDGPPHAHSSWQVAQQHGSDVGNGSAAVHPEEAELTMSMKQPNSTLLCVSGGQDVLATDQVVGDQAEVGFMSSMTVPGIGSTSGGSRADASQALPAKACVTFETMQGLALQKVPNGTGTHAGVYVQNNDCDQLTVAGMHESYTLTEQNAPSTRDSLPGLKRSIHQVDGVNGVDTSAVKKRDIAVEGFV